jgi:sporulation protein YlmC with PRC-barrel domain
MDYDELAALAGAEVQSEDGEVVGEIVAVHVDEGSDEARLVEIAGEERTQHYIVPVGEASVGAGGIVLPYSRGWARCDRLHPLDRGAAPARGARDGTRALG